MAQVEQHSKQKVVMEMMEIESQCKTRYVDVGCKRFQRVEVEGHQGRIEQGCRGCSRAREETVA